MTTTYSIAVDTMFAALNNVLPDTVSIVGYVPEIRWANQEERTKAAGDKFWIRVSQQTIEEPQSTLSDCAGIPGDKRYTTNGLLFIQIFAPKSTANSSSLGRQLAEFIKAVYRGKSLPGAIWFRNTRVNELSPEELFYRFNVITEYQYDELG